MAGLVPAIHVLLADVLKKAVDAGDKRGHDGGEMFAPSFRPSCARRTGGASMTGAENAYAPSAPRTRSGANGNSRRRTPVSAAMALPTAQATTGTPSSPAPVGGLSVDTTFTSMLGTSDMRVTS